ncbi:MAG TPA: hypothetical protein VGP07_25810 [Polyangia bacterium]|jgi:hypothetical protein
MSELPRLFDESENDAERALLHAGMSYRGSRETRTKTLAALGLAGSTAIVAGGAAAATGAASWSSLLNLSGAKFLLAVTVVGAVTAIPVGYRALHKHHAAAAMTQPAATAGAKTATGSVTTAGLALEAPAPVATPNVTPAVLPTSARPTRPTGETVSLTQELVALDAARVALARGNAQGALFLLDEYVQTCPRGRLKLEAELLRVDALARNGQTELARHRAEAFLRRHPASVLAARARSYLDD